ncbi:cation transporter [Paeniroseomonas aquatica]
MDCAGCVAKVTRAVERMPGVTEVQVNLMAERLSASLSLGETTPEAVAQQVATLGYTATPLADTFAPFVAKPPPDDHAGHGHAHGHHDDDPADAEKPWWITGKAKLVWLLGGLVLGAYALSLALPERLTYPLFLAATLVALVPFGRRAFALARAGSPFSIETLMVTAAVGATVIGAAEEAAVVVLLFALGELLENVAPGAPAPASERWPTSCRAPPCGFSPTARPNNCRPTGSRSATWC